MTNRTETVSEVNHLDETDGAKTFLNDRKTQRKVSYVTYHMTTEGNRRNGPALRGLANQLVDYCSVSWQSTKFGEHSCVATRVDP